MKRNWKGFLSGCIVTTVLFGMIGTAAATVGSRTVTVDYNNIKVTLDGEQVNLVDANGSIVEPFSIDGTTYLPVRAVATALGLDVGWDPSTTTVVLSAENNNQSTSTSNTSGATIGQSNALRKAESYLSFMPFSYSGLVEQLEFEGFST